MNYELAKELKDAGFPQEGKGHFLTRTFKDFDEAIQESPDISKVYVPTFSELIEACGNKFGALFPPYTTSTGMGGTDDTENWKAGGYIKKDQGVYGLGKTSEEAVAKLYIALYNKGNAKSNKNTEPN